MTEQIHKIDGTPYDPRNLDVAVEALKRGHNGEGYPVAVFIESIGAVATFDAGDRERIAQAVDHPTSINPIRGLGQEIIAIAAEKPII